jgi:hypothetical protein
MEYIATKPVRFDRDYGIGEIIPPHVIHPNTIKRLVDAGKIQRMNPSDVPKLPGEAALDEKLEDYVERLEEILGIQHGDAPHPDTNERAEACIACVAEIVERAGIAAESELASDETQERNADGAPTDTQETSTDATPMQESPGDTHDQPQNASGNDGDNVGETKQDKAQENAGDVSDGQEAICPICGKIFKSQAALNAHMKSHK